GYSLARFQRDRLAAGGGLTILRGTLTRVVLPYYILLVSYTIASRKFDPFSLALVSNFHGRWHSLLEPYWFIEAYVQCYLIIILLSAFGPVRRMIREDPWQGGVIFLLLTVAAKVSLYAVFQHDYLHNR